MSQETSAEQRDPVSSASEPDGRPTKPWRTFWLLALIEFVVVLDTSIVNIALPSIQMDLGFSATGLAWVVDAYLLAFAGFLLLGGRVADLVGRRRLFLVGLTVFTLASLANGLALADWHLVTSRIVQGLGGAMVVPAALALITDLFPEGPERGKALGIFGGMGGVAAGIGVVTGGLLTAIGWEWIFLINVPVGIAVFAFGLKLLPANRPHPAGGIDLIGAITGTAGLCLLVVAMTRGASHGWGTTESLVEFGAAAALLAVFVLRQRFAASPMIPTILLKQRNLVVGNIVMAFVGTLMFGVFFIITLYIQDVRGLGPAQAGLLYLPIPVCTFLGTQLAPRVAMKFGPHNALGLGMVLQILGLVWWAAAIAPEGHVIGAFLAPAMLWGLGVGTSIVASFIVCTMGLSGEVAGAGSGLATTNQNAGGAVGLAVLATVAAAGTAAAASEPTKAALVSGYSMALWSAAGLAVVALLISRLLRMGGPEPAE